MARITPVTLTGGYASIDVLNDNFVQLAAEFEKCIYKDGEAPNGWSATQDANNQRLINLPLPQTGTEPVTVTDLQNGSFLPDEMVIVGLPGEGDFIVGDATGVWLKHTAAQAAAQLDHGFISGLADNDHPQYLLKADIDDTPVNGELTAPISSNWAFDHVAAADPHPGYLTQAEGDALYTPAGATHNMLLNGSFSVAQRGTAFTATSLPVNNDDTYLLDRWNLLSDGNDAVDVSQETTIVPTGAWSAVKWDVETANKKFGFLQVLTGRDSKKAIGGNVSLSFKARKVVGNATLDSLRAAVISWSGAEDTVTSDIVNLWGAEDVNPTLVANWTYENAPSNLTLTDSFQTFTINNIPIDTASTKNIAVFIWVNNGDATIGDLAYISDVQLEVAAAATPFAKRSFEDEFEQCCFFAETVRGEAAGSSMGVGFNDTTTSARHQMPYKKKRTTPTIVFGTAASDFSVRFKAAATAVCTAISSGTATKDCVFIVADVAAGLTAGEGSALRAVNANAVIFVEAEL